MAIRKLGETWQIDYYDPNGKRIRRCFKLKKDAVAELGKRQALISEGRYLDVKREYDTTLEDAADFYKTNFGRQSSWRVKSGFIDIIKKHFGSDKKLSDIRYRDLETFRSHLKSRITYKGTFPTDATVNKQMSCLRHLIKKSVEWELIGENPFQRGSSLLIKENNSRLRYLTENEIDRLLDSCSTKIIQLPHNKSRLSQMTRRDEFYLRDIVECVILTGMRKSELLSLKWDQIRGGHIYLKKTKTKNPRQIPINEDLDALFKRIRQRQGLKSKYIFILAGKRIGDIKSSFAAALKRANIEDFRFHDLRHTFASHFVMRGGDLKALQELLGHKTIQMTMRYAHLAPGHKQKAIRLLNGLTTKNHNGQKIVNSEKDENSKVV